MPWLIRQIGLASTDSCVTDIGLRLLRDDVKTATMSITCVGCSEATIAEKTLLRHYHIVTSRS